MVEKYMKIIVQKTVTNKIIAALIKARKKETKGACFAYRSSNDCYYIEDIFISREKGTFFFSNLKANFQYRRFEKKYHKKHKFDYLNHNYVGDWHSHPSFECVPSNYDKREVEDELAHSNANFLIQLIVKMVENNIIGRCFIYQENKSMEECELLFE